MYHKKKGEARDRAHAFLDSELVTVATTRSILLLLALLAGLAWFVGAPKTPAPVAVPPPPVIDTRRIALEVRARVEPSLDWAHEESLLAVNDELHGLSAFFQQAKTRTPQFADAVMSWGSKWRLLVDQVPGTTGERHREFIREKFAETLFDEESLTHAVEQVIRGYADKTQSLENEMLVRMRADVEDLPAASLAALSRGESLSAAFQEAIDRAMHGTSDGLRADVATLVVAVMAEEVLAQAAVRLGVSAGILGAGAGSSWATLGVGLAVGVIIDQIVTLVWEWWADPQGSLTQEVDARLDDLHRAIVEGDAEHPGLRPQLLEFARARDALRREAIDQMVGLPPSEDASSIFERQP